MLHLFNTGGTFNKRYDPGRGELIVPADDRAVERALEPLRINLEIAVTGLIYKDSLEMDDADRQILADTICNVEERHLVVVHGTDTMDRSAEAVAKRLAQAPGKCVVFTGAMVPFFLDGVEATANLTLALASARILPPGVYIAMHGLALPYTQIRKNREKGIFERIEG